ncbi:hypothetical protein BH23BAC1_BH23BAC1_43950 [soil metagenome]
MDKNEFDIIVIGTGSAGLSVGLFMNEAGFKILMIDKSDQHIGGECLNDGCVPSKALIHVSKIMAQAKLASNFGLCVQGKVDLKKALNYVTKAQGHIRSHENKGWLENQGIHVVLGEAKFIGKKEIEAAGSIYKSNKIVIATGSKPRKLQIPGVEKVKYYDNENIFRIDEFPERLLIIGGGPIGMEIGQAFNRLGAKVTVVHQGAHILEHDDIGVTEVLLQQLQKEGIEFLMQAKPESFITENETLVKLKDGSTRKISFDAVFVGIGRELDLKPLKLDKAGIKLKHNKIVSDKHLRTSNKNVFVCGDVAGNLNFSHAAESHARMLINNFLSPIKKKLNNDHFSWVTFTDPELATFGLNEKQLKDRNKKYRRLETDFSEEDRAVTDNYRYGKSLMFISQGGLFHKEKVLGGTMVAPNAGELIQELILANSSKLSIDAIFNKIYPYPVATRVNQKTIIEYKQEGLTKNIRKLLKMAFKIFS